MGNLQNSYVKLDKVSKIYKMGEVEIRAVDNISFEISKGEFVVVVGPSGAGKTTVLNILGGMDTATKGNVFVDGSNIAKYNKKVLCEVGLEDRMGNFPAQLSGGEQQRVSIARALAKNPKLLLCDEPTGALDYQTGKAILKLLQDMCREKGMTVIVITHNSALTPMADRVIHIKNGTVSAMELNTDPTPVEEIEW